MNCDTNIKLVGMNVDDYSSSESESESETSENQESATTSTARRGLVHLLKNESDQNKLNLLWIAG